MKEQTDLSGYVHDEKATRKLKFGPVQLVIGLPMLGALGLTFYFGFADSKTHALYAGLVFAALLAVIFLYLRFRGHICSTCRAPIETEYHDMRPDDRAHSGTWFRSGAVPHGFSEDVTYAKTYNPSG